MRWRKFAEGRSADVRGRPHGPHGVLADDRPGGLDRATLYLLDAALMELPRQTRAIFLLRRLDHLAYPEIARRVGLSVSEVEAQLVIAARHLIEHAAVLEEAGGGGLGVPR